MAERLMTIGQVAKAAGLSATTLRYYEREQILAPTDRSQAGYRLYDPDAVERLRFVRSAQAVGFTLDDIRTLLELEQDRGPACQGEVQRLLQRRLADVDEKMNELKRVQAALGRALDRCRRSNGECAVMKEIGPKKRRR